MSVSRPRVVAAAIAVLAASHAFSLFITSAYPHAAADVPVYLAASVLLLGGLWFGAGFTRVVALLLFLPDAVLHLSALHAGFSPSTMTLLPDAVQAVALGMLWSPRANAWFAARSVAILQMRWLPFAIVALLISAIPLWILAFASKSGALVLGGALALGGDAWIINRVLAALAHYLFALPLAIARAAGFSTGHDVLPNGAMGWLFAIGCHAVLWVIAGTAWMVTRRTDVPTGRGEVVDWPRMPKAVAIVVGTIMLVLVAPLFFAEVAYQDAARAREVKAAADAAAEALPVPAYEPVEGRFTIKDETGLYGVESNGYWKLTDGRLEIVAESTRLRNLKPECIHCPALAAWQFRLRNTYGAASLPPEPREGFAPMPLPRDGAITVASHRMTAAVPRPAKLADYWIGIDLEYESGDRTRLHASDVFHFADALAARKLAPDRCAAPRDVGDAVERGCHDRLVQMLGNPLGRDQVGRSSVYVRAFPTFTVPIEIAERRGDLESVDLLIKAGATRSAKRP